MSDVKISVGVTGAAEAAKSVGELRKSATGAGSDLGAMQEPTNRLADALAQVKAQGDEAAKTADKTGQEMAEMGKGALGAGHLLHGLEAASNGSARGLFSAATGARHLMEAMGMGALGPVALIIGGITAGALALWKALDNSEEEAKKLAERTKEVKEGIEKWRSIHLDDIQKEYQNVRAEVDATLKSTELLHDAQLRLMDARTAGKLVDLEIDEQLALGKLSPGDTLGRKKVSKNYADKRADVQDQSNVDKAFVGVQLAQKKSDAAAEKERLIEQQGEALAEQFKTVQRTMGNLKEEDDGIGFKLTELFLSKSDREFLLKRRADIKEELKNLQDEQRERIEKRNKLADQYDDQQAVSAAAGIDVETAKAGFSTARNRRNVTTAKSRNDDQQIDAEEQQKEADRSSEKAREGLQQRLRDLEKEREANARQDQDDQLEEQRVKLADRQAREKRRRENVIRKRDHQPLLPDFPESGEPEENIERRGSSEQRNRELEDRRRAIDDEQRALELADRERKRSYETTPLGPHTNGPLEKAPDDTPAPAAGPKRIAWGADAEAMGAHQKADQTAEAIKTLTAQIAAANDGLHGAYIEGMKKLLQQLQHQAEQVRQLPTGN